MLCDADGTHDLEGPKHPAGRILALPVPFAATEQSAASRYTFGCRIMADEYSPTCQSSNVARKRRMELCRERIRLSCGYTYSRSSDPRTPSDHSPTSF